MATSAKLLNTLTSSARSFTRRFRSKPTLAQAIAEQREALKDLAEKGIWEAVTRGERWAIMFVLTTIGKDRGWALPKNGLLTDEPSQLNTVTVNNIAINGLAHDTFAPAGTESVHIEAIAPPPPEPESEDDTLIIEGEFTEADDAGS